MKPTIYDTTSVRFTINTAHLKALVNFLTVHRDIVDPTSVSQRKLTTKTSMTTSMSRLYEHLLSSGGYTKYIRTMTLDKSIDSIPEMMTFRHIPLDMYQLATAIPDMAQPIRVFPEYNQNIMVDTTSITSARDEITDTLAFHSGIVRDILSRSYHQASGNWLTPDQVKYVVRVYSMTISQALTGTFKLDMSQRQRVATVFAYFYLTQLVGSENAGGMLIAGPKDMGLMKDDSIQDTVAFIESKYPPRTTNMTLEMVFDILHGLNIPRLRVDRRILNSQLGKLGPDVHTSAISLEYPPYFIYLIGLAASGAKNKMTFLLKNSPRGLPAANDFIMSFVKNNNIHAKT